MSKVLKGLVVIITLGLLVQCMSGMETSYASEPTRPYAQSTSTYQTTNKSTSTTNKSTTTNTTNKSTTVTTTTTTTKPVATPKPDSRVSTYKGTNPDYQAVKYTWKMSDGREAYATFYVDYNAYTYYHSLDRYYAFDDYMNYINDEYSQAAVKAIVESLRDLQKKAGLSNDEVMFEAINLVQSAIAYEYDSVGTGEVDYPKYPIETLVERKGDCEDSAILLAAIVKELGYGCILMYFEGHMAVGILGEDNLVGGNLTVDGKKYFYVETTGTGWELGQIPDGYSNDNYKGYLLVY